MILIWGFRTYARLLGILTFICASCHNPAAQRAEETVRKFTLFFVPLFAISRRTTITCTFCGTSIGLSKEDAARLRDDLAAQQEGRRQPFGQQPGVIRPTAERPTAERPTEQPAPEHPDLLPAREWPSPER